MSTDPSVFRAAVLAELDATPGWFDRAEVQWLRENPEEPIGEIEIDAPFNFAALLGRLNKEQDR